jgi:hypothetical protein
VVVISSLGKNNENLRFIEVFFYDRNTVPKSTETIILKTELLLSFAHSRASLFQGTIKVIEGDDMCVTESALAVKTLFLEPHTRRDEHFIPYMVKKLLI